MNFMLSDQQKEMSETVLRLARTLGEGLERRTVFESETGWPEQFWTELMQLGVGGICVGEDHGGLSLSMIDLALVAETLGYAAAPGPFLGHALATLAISTCASEEQKARLLPDLASGHRLATIAIGEPGGRHLPEASLVVEKGGLLTGEKRNVLFPEQADIIVVSAASGFAIVERTGPGLGFVSRDVADRTRRLSDVSFDAAPAEALPIDGRSIIRDAALILIAADAFGGARRCLDMSADYAKTREQFGRRIGSFQAIKHQLANMAVEVEPARGLYWYAAYAFDSVPEDRSRMAAAAKAHICDVFMQAARQMVEIHGGIGFTWDHDAQIYFKRALFDFAYLGTPSSHRGRYAEMAGWNNATAPKARPARTKADG